MYHTYVTVFILTMHAQVSSEVIGGSFVLFMSCVCHAFIAALWSPAGEGLTSLLSFVMFNCVFVTFPCGILGQVWYLIESIPDLCHLSYLVCHFDTCCIFEQ